MDCINMIYAEGSSGKRYRFYPFKEIDHLKKAGGVFMLTKKNKYDAKTCYEVIFVGETSDMSTLSKENLADSIPNAFEANCYCVRLVEDDDVRSSTYNDLKESYSIDCT